MIEPIIVLGPLLAAFIAGVFQRYLGDKVAMAITTGSVCLSAVLSIYTFANFAFLGAPELVIELFPFIDVAGFTSVWSIRIDTMSAVMLVVVTGVSSLVHIYSIGYMADDPHRARFFSYLSFFTFAMLSLVTANDFLQMFFGWEGVGVASYLLIGFWYEKRSANDASIKAFVTNRVGDFGFALGIMACFFFIGTIKFFPTEAGDLALFTRAVDGVVVTGQLEKLAHQAMVWGDYSIPATELVALLLFIGAMGKSAQFFLHVWLPDAMEGPTPVSALIHAATMVTAGVFMVCRLSELYEMAPHTAGIVTIIGAVTALFAATVGLAQNDIKRVVAYSTCSQLGYMFFAAGVGAYNVAMFHLFTHAFFKALLFLGSGSVIHGLHHEQDMRKMGGVRVNMMLTWLMMLIGTLALTGVGIPGTQIGFAGFFSKDAAIEHAFMASETGRTGAEMAFWFSVIAAFLTSFYSWRLMFMTFEGTYRGEAHSHDGHGHGDHGHDDHGHDDHGHDGHAHAAPAVGHAHNDHAHDHAKPGAAPAHESPWVMMVPLFVLAAGAVFAGIAFAPYFIGDHAQEFWRHVIMLPGDHAPAAAHAAVEAHAPVGEHAAPAGEHAAPDEEHGEGGGGHHVPDWVLWAPFVVTLSGFLLALPLYFFSQTAGAAIARGAGPIHAFLYNKWYFDEIYDFVFVKGARALGDLLWKVGDRRIIDGLGPNGLAWLAKFGGRQMRRVQSGLVYHYSFIMLAAIVAFGVYALWFAGAW